MRHRTDRQDPVTVMSEDADKDEDTTAEADFIAIHREGFEAGLAKLRLACKKPTSGSFSKHKYDSMVVARTLGVTYISHIVMKRAARARNTSSKHEL